MSELEESVLRSQTILMMARNDKNSKMVKRILKRFMKFVTNKWGCNVKEKQESMERL